MTSIFFHGSCFCLLLYFSNSCTVKVGESDVRTSATTPSPVCIECFRPYPLSCFNSVAKAISNVPEVKFSHCISGQVIADRSARASASSQLLNSPI